MRAGFAIWRPGGLAGAILALALAAGPSIAADPPAAPSPDPLAHLARDVSAVFDLATDPHLLLLEEDHNVFASRTLRPGEDYADGWKLETIRATSVTLRKGEAVRTIEIRGRDQIAAETPAPAPPGAPRPAGPGVFTVAAIERPPKPEVNRPGQVKAGGAAAHTPEQLNALAAGLRQNLGESAPAASSILVTDLKSNLAGLGPDTALSHIPQGQTLQITGEIWLADGGYSPRVTSFAANGTANSTFDMAPDGGSNIYGSATTYDVEGDTVIVHKAMQIGGQTYVMPALPVRSGDTAVVNLPDGSVFRITPVIQKGP